MDPAVLAEEEEDNPPVERRIMVAAELVLRVKAAMVSEVTRDFLAQEVLADKMDKLLVTVDNLELAAAVKKMTLPAPEETEPMVV